MANKRTPISKKMRFEGFKKDKFTCQYCGRTAPDVVLEVDHINPVAEGGTNDILNLITSCMSCNRGKGKRKLDDLSEIQKQQEKLKELARKNEQLEMMIEWRKSLSDFENNQAQKIAEYFGDLRNCSVSDCGKEKIKKWVKEFGVDEILLVIDICDNTYGDNNNEFVFGQIPKIANIRKRSKNDPQLYYYNYIKKCLKNEFTYVNYKELHSLIYENVFDDQTFEIVKQIFKESRNWNDFSDKMEEYFGCEE